MGRCSECGLLAGEGELTCTFCRVRTRWWTVLDDIPVGLRSWAISTVRIWTGIIQEEADKYLEFQRAREAAENTAAAKSASLAKPPSAPKEGSEKKEEAERPDKSWIKPKEEKDRPKSPGGSPGVVEIVGVEEEGKTSSGSKVLKEDQKTPKRRSRSDKRRERSRSRHSRKRRKKSSSPRSKPAKEDRDRSRKRDQPVRDKEKKARPTVRPPTTPSRSPPKGRGGPPPKEPPVARHYGPPPAVQRPTGRQWSGPIQAWHREPQYWGTNKGRKKKEEQYYFRR